MRNSKRRKISAHSILKPRVNTICPADENKTTISSVTTKNHCERMTGFSARNQQNIADKYKCKICTFILREPVQLNCSHRQCKACFESKIEQNTFICPECREATNEKEVFLDKGCKNDMKSLKIECSLCEWNGKFQDYEAHLTQQHQNPACQFCGQQFSSISALDLHKMNDCERVTVPCGLVTFGCSSEIIRKHMLEHYLSLEHQIAVMSFIRGDTPKIKSESNEAASSMDVDVHSFTIYPHTPNEDVSQTIEVLNGGLRTLTDDVQRLTDESRNLESLTETLSKDVASLKISVTEQTTYLETLKPTQDNLIQEVSGLKLKMDDIITVSNEGIFIWKLSNFSEKMADALAERQTSIYSPPFFSSPTGYKMRVRLYPNGDGSAKKTHMSLFFVLMRSDYDAILKFPFHFKVTFCLYDQSGAQKHIVDSFRPDIKSNSFQRPRSEMNIASGIPKFVLLSTLQENASSYIRDDTIFIKIMIDFIDLPKALLAYALNLNPAFPMNIQQSMIRQEEKKAPTAVSTPTNA